MVPPIRIAFDGLSGVDGSARFSFGPSTALASVSGPIAARLATEHPVRAAIDLHVRPLSAVPSTSEKHAATALRGILERACILAQHPRTLVQIVVQALSPPPPPPPPSDQADDASDVLLLAAEINACSLALLNAGSVPMRGVVCAIAVAQAAPESRPQLVGAAGARDRAASTGCFAFLFGVDRACVEGASGTVPPSRLIWTHFRASPGETFSVQTLAEAEKVALEGATVVWTKMKQSLGASSFAGGALS